MVLGEAAPQGGRDHDRALLRDQQGRAPASLAAQIVVDTGGEVRPVLLGRGDGQKHDRALGGAAAQGLGGHAVPQDFGHRSSALIGHASVRD